MLTITHTHETGTIIEGTSKGDRTAEILKANRWRWGRSIAAWYIPHSRDVSGGAYGVDGAAHRATLTRGGSTIAFVAGSAARVYPAAHAHLFARIAESGGAIVSETPVDAAPTKWRFLMQKRSCVNVQLGLGPANLVGAGRQRRNDTPRHADSPSPQEIGCRYPGRTLSVVDKMGAARLCRVIPRLKAASASAPPVEESCIRLWRQCWGAVENHMDVTTTPCGASECRYPYVVLSHRPMQDKRPTSDGVDGAESLWTEALSITPIG